MRLPTIRSGFATGFLLLAIVITVAVLRLRLLDVPLERDEGEYAYMAQLLLDGVPPYVAAYNMKFPGIYFLYALIIGIFGQTHTAIHFGLLLLNVASTVMLYFLGRKVFDQWVGLTASAAFGLLSLSYHVQGLWANAEHFVIPFALAGFLLLKMFAETSKGVWLFLGGLMLGGATVVKQPGGLFALCGFAYIIGVLLKSEQANYRKTLFSILLFAGGVVLPLGVTAVYLSLAGVMDRFLFWAFTYAKEYGTQIPLRSALTFFLANFLPLLKSTVLLWILAALGLVVLCLAKDFKRERLFVITFFTAGMLSTSLGFFFRPHYFILFLPAAALMVGIGARFLFLVFSNLQITALRIAFPAVCVGMAFVGSIGSHADVFFRFTPAEVTRATYGGNPFIEAPMISTFIKERTRPHDKIAIIGNEPEILFYSQRRSVTGHIYIYALMEEHPYADRLQQEMIREIESGAPKLLVYTHVLPEWYKKFEAEERLLQWLWAFTDKHYKLLARLEYTPGGNLPQFLTEETALSKKPQQVYWLSIYERIEARHTQ